MKNPASQSFGGVSRLTDQDDSSQELGGVLEDPLLARVRGHKPRRGFTIRIDRRKFVKRVQRALHKKPKGDLVPKRLAEINL